MNRVHCWIAGVIMIASIAAAAQETRRLELGHASPAADLEDLSWLAGEWLGEGITGPAREVYSPPMGGAIAGHLVQARGDEVLFYEIITIVQSGETLVYRLKHFNADLIGWEERDEVQTFAFVARVGDTWFFDGLTIRRTSPNTMVGAVLAATRYGTSREFAFHYRKVR